MGGLVGSYGGLSHLRHLTPLVMEYDVNTVLTVAIALGDSRANALGLVIRL